MDKKGEEILGTAFDRLQQILSINKRLRDGDIDEQQANRELEVLEDNVKELSNDFENFREQREKEKQLVEREIFINKCIRIIVEPIEIDRTNDKEDIIVRPACTHNNNCRCSEITVKASSFSKCLDLTKGTKYRTESDKEHYEFPGYDDKFIILLGTLSRGERFEQIYTYLDIVDYVRSISYYIKDNPEKRNIIKALNTSLTILHTIPNKDGADFLRVGVIIPHFYNYFDMKIFISAMENSYCLVGTFGDLQILGDRDNKKSKIFLIIFLIYAFKNDGYLKMTKNEINWMINNIPILPLKFTIKLKNSVVLMNMCVNTNKLAGMLYGASYHFSNREQSRSTGTRFYDTRDFLNSFIEHFSAEYKTTTFENIDKVRKDLNSKKEVKS